MKILEVSSNKITVMAGSPCVLALFSSSYGLLVSSKQGDMFYGVTYSYMGKSKYRSVRFLNLLVCYSKVSEF